MNRNDSLSRNTFLLIIGTFLNKGLQFLVIPFFSKWLTTAEYGEFDLLCTYVSLLIPIITLATQEAMFRFSVNEEDVYVQKTYITNTFVIQVFNFLIVAVLLQFFKNKIGTTIYIIFCFYLFAELISVFLRGYLRAIKKLNIYSVSMSISTVFMAIAVVVFVKFLNMKLEGILLGYAIGTFIGDLCIFFGIKVYRMFAFEKIKFSILKKLITYSAPLIPNDIAWWIMNASDRQLINYLFGSTANGIYAITHKIPAICSILFNMFSISWQQEVVQRINDKDKEEYFNEVLNSLLELLLTVGAGLLSGSFIVYYYVFDPKYFEAILYSPILISSAILLSVSQFFGGIQIALKRPKQNGITTVIGAIVNIGVHIGIYRYVGLYAAALSTFIANGVILFMRVIFVKKDFRIHVKKKILFVFMGFLYFFFMSYLHQNMLLNGINIFAVCIFGGVVNFSRIKKIIGRFHNYK